MRKISSFLFFAVLILFLACQKEQPPITGTISGNLSSYDPAILLVKTPVEGIKLWLVNADFKFDTVTFAGNRAAIVDSTFSDANGNYLFDNIPLGNYYVVPVPDSAGYNFEPIPAMNSDPLAINTARPSQQLNFSSPLPGGNNSSVFKLYVDVGNNLNKLETYKAYRQCFVLFIPFFITEDISSGHKNELSFTTPDLGGEYGITLGLLTQTNNFLINFHDSTDLFVESYWIVQDLGNTPAISRWAINLNAHTITRTSP